MHSRSRIVTNHVLQILLVFVFLCVPGHDVLVPIVPRRMWPASESEEGLFLTWGHDCLNRQDLFFVCFLVFFVCFFVICGITCLTCWHMVTRLVVTFFMAVRKRNSRSTSDEIWKRIVEGGVAFFWDHFFPEQTMVLTGESSVMCIHGLGLLQIMFFRYFWCLCFFVCLDMMF